jgi:phosphatidylethanolamine-binding protein (PEBP) family uncharacterized protein
VKPNREDSGHQQPPAGTAELVLIVQDPDVPFGKPATHALTPGINPSLNGIPENALTNPSPIPGIRHGKGALGRRGWAGPTPPRSHGPHTYAFQPFALDQAPGLPASFTLNDVIAAIKGRYLRGPEDITDAGKASSTPP